MPSRIAPGQLANSSSQSASASAPKILDVGCGQNKYPGAIGIDSNPRANADVIHDLGVLPYPFPDNDFDLIICRHVIEHVPDVMSFVSELHRISKPAGLIKIVTPHYSNPDWATDPTHRNHFNSYSFTCFMPDRTPFPFYTTVELRPVRTYVSLANLWRMLGFEWITNLDQRWPALRFTRKFWEFYLSNIFRGKELHFEFEVVKADKP
ncbi:MAG TPA: class I SAM-dependent methyltransferase [Pyrinomonadaceae bacterium]|nr:class I SAM-dependent methyltransferase [Pyrinomonadaceae bacterium]